MSDEDIMATVKEQLLNQGRLEGIQKGKSEGKAEGKQEGMLEGMFNGIVDIVQLRFARIPETFKERLKQVKDVEKLRLIHKKAVMTDSFDELRAALEQV